MPKNKGMVVKIKSDYCVVVDQEGTFIKMPKPKEEVQVGQEILIEVAKPFSWLKLGTLVASLLLLVNVALWAWLPAQEQLAVAYVSLDINPSMELGINQAGEVIEATGLNADGKKVLSLVEPERLKVQVALEKIIKQSLELNYLKSTSDNVLVLSVTNTKPNSTLQAKNLQQQVATSLESAHLRGKIVAYDSRPDTREKAQQQKLSTGKLLIYEEMAGNQQVPLDTLRTTSVAQLTRQGLVALDAAKVHSINKSLMEVDGKHHKELTLQSPSGTSTPSAPDKAKVPQQTGQAKRPGQDRKGTNSSEDRGNAQTNPRETGSEKATGPKDKLGVTTTPSAPAAGANTNVDDTSPKGGVKDKPRDKKTTQPDVSNSGNKDSQGSQAKSEQKDKEKATGSEKQKDKESNKDQTKDKAGNNNKNDGAKK